MVKRLEERLEEKLDNDEEIPIKVLNKVLDNCSNNKCSSLDKLVKVAENVFSEFDAKIVEKINRDKMFEQLRFNLIVNLTASTDSPTLNSTESNLIDLEENYPTTVRFLKTSDLNAEHKDLDSSDELDLEEDANKTYRIF